MRTYKLGTIDLYRPEDDCYCVLGVYLNEKYPEVLKDEATAYNRLNSDCGEDLKAMQGVIRAHERSGPWGPWSPADPIFHVYSASDDGAPVEVLEEALAAVGIEVKLEDHRPPGRRGDGSYWTMTRAKA